MTAVRLLMERERGPGMSDKADRIKGVLVGQAAGDALGVGYETGRRSHWRAKMIGGRSGFEPGCGCPPSGATSGPGPSRWRAAPRGRPRVTSARWARSRLPCPPSRGSATWPTASSTPSASAATPARWQPSPGPCWARCTAPRRSCPSGGTSCTAGRVRTGGPALFCLRLVPVRQVLRVAAYDSAVSSSLAVRPARVGDVAQMARVHVRC